MTDASASLSLDIQLLDWGIDLQAAACGQCHSRYLVAPSLTAGKKPLVCPECHTPTLNIFNEGFADLGLACRPELVIQFKVTEEQAFQSLEAFTAAVQIPPADLNPKALKERLVPLYLPMWLVDAKLLVYWDAEVGFQYTVISHAEKYSDITGWQSQEVQEPRTRWESRIGRINRTYQNVAVPAIDGMDVLQKKMGGFNHQEAETYTPGSLTLPSSNRPILVRLPDFNPKESWSDAAAAFQQAVTNDCQQACHADQIRQFRWKAKFSNLNWTLLLLPVYQTYYKDDADQIHPILINGHTGSISGHRSPSSKRIAQISLILLITGIALALIGLYFDKILLIFLSIFFIFGTSIPYFLSQSGRQIPGPK